MASKVQRRSNSQSLPVAEITFDPPKVTLKNQGLSMRSDHLKQLRYLSVDLVLDDYDYSASEIARCAVALFLSMPLERQLLRLGQYRKMERRALKKVR